MELGAGTALPSIVACIKGAHVISTDIMPGLQIAERNLEENKESFKGFYESYELDWTNLDHRNKAKKLNYDFILLSDLFYLPVICI